MTYQHRLQSFQHKPLVDLLHGAMYHPHLVRMAGIVLSLIHQQQNLGIPMPVRRHTALVLQTLPFPCQ